MVIGIVLGITVGIGDIILGTSVHGIGTGTTDIGGQPEGIGMGTILPIVITPLAMSTPALVPAVVVPDWQPTATTVVVWMQRAVTAITLAHVEQAVAVVQV